MKHLEPPSLERLSRSYREEKGVFFNGVHLPVVKRKPDLASTVHLPKRGLREELDYRDGNRGVLINGGECGGEAGEEFMRPIHKHFVMQ